MAQKEKQANNGNERTRKMEKVMFSKCLMGVYKVILSSQSLHYRHHSHFIDEETERYRGSVTCEGHSSDKVTQVQDWLKINILSIMTR